MSVEMLVLYGSETGNARELAEYLYRECIYRDLSVRLSEMNQITVQELQSVSSLISLTSNLVYLYLNHSRFRLDHACILLSVFIIPVM